ncbi:SubName: Full=Uncharacterized protein {ECO:0000313/EMBL:CCA68751.1} [Serendipita indica DSM 11827]|uniref:Cryptic loci regulator 2 N-terminal domain-containing protein n=1 Tax=Serendipita indica (strain DSM 11827) TaxID=1109443 RepID=G4TBQ8_SERID|nr:SubName: Full=Uncharacterized protein {ECO:0000313/EMBL:CCA68751.1} [Serendipita indica DSM 11827]CCA68751.1 hypothetical protein PIIN_02614 [Serendipita indica DSM 11827]
MSDYKPIDWPNFSDGNPAAWPSNNSGFVRCDNDATSQLWLQKLGKVIATILGYQQPQKYQMNGWPNGYAVFSTVREDSTRSDHYLYGGNRKYRSAAEFQAHAVWLFFAGKPPTNYEELLPKSSPRTPKPSALKAGSSQSPLKRPRSPEIARSIDSQPELKKIGGPSLKKISFIEMSSSSTLGTGLSSQTVIPTNTSSASDFSKDDSPDEDRQTRRLLSIQKRPSEPVRMFPTREQLHKPSRTFRIGELVWCAVDPPLRGTIPGAVIDQWPGLIEDNRVQKEIRGNVVTERRLYHVKLLAITDTFVLPPEMVIPYRLSSAPESLIEVLRTVRPPMDLRTAQSLYHFRHNIAYSRTQYPDHSRGEPPSDQFLQASGFYALASQTAAHLALCWGLAHPAEINDHDTDSSSLQLFSALWWGAELIYIEEMVVLRFSRGVIGNHGAVAGLFPSRNDSDNSAVLLRIRLIERDGRKCMLTGSLYELVSDTSIHTPTPSDLTPIQPPPSGMMWRNLLPAKLEVRVEVVLVACRYYPDRFEFGRESMRISAHSAPVLNGLRAGSSLNTFPLEFAATRSGMARHSHTAAQKELLAFYNEEMSE